MNSTAIRGASAIVFLILVGCGSDDPPTFTTTESLGEALYFDTDLSFNRTQACATCHDPDHAFVDPRLNDMGQNAVGSLGDDGVSRGGRNAPTAAYAAFAPNFSISTRARQHRRTNDRLYEGPLGGQFWDGRATDLEAQAGGPPISAVEMGMPNAAAVVDRLRANPDYVGSFRHLFGDDVFTDVERAYEGMTAAIASFERTDLFSPFDSKYDRSLRGEAVLSFKELTGKSLFFAEFASCSTCHQLHAVGDPVNKFRETFTGYEYHNVGTPLRAGKEPDRGLVIEDDGSSATREGLFKVPTLRNIAVTGPYMHNGSFRELRTVIEFYDKFVNEERVNNPETGQPWAAPQFPDSVSESLLKAGRPMSEGDVQALVCFLRTLTDAAYVHLIPDDGIDCAD